jgi:hypothetical protein
MLLKLRANVSLIHFTVTSKLYIKLNDLHDETSLFKISIFKFRAIIQDESAKHPKLVLTCGIAQVNRTLKARGQIKGGRSISIRSRIINLSLAAVVQHLICPH